MFVTTLSQTRHVSRHFVEIQSYTNQCVWLDEVVKPDAREG